MFTLQHHKIFAQINAYIQGKEVYCSHIETQCNEVGGKKRLYPKLEITPGSNELGNNGNKIIWRAKNNLDFIKLFGCRVSEIHRSVLIIFIKLEHDMIFQLKLKCDS